MNHPFTSNVQAREFDLQRAIKVNSIQNKMVSQLAQGSPEAADRYWESRVAVVKQKLVGCGKSSGRLW